MIGSMHSTAALLTKLTCAKADLAVNEGQVEKMEVVLASMKKSGEEIRVKIADYKRTLDILAFMEKVGGAPLTFPEGEPKI